MGSKKDSKKAKAKAEDAAVDELDTQLDEATEAARDSDEQSREEQAAQVEAVAAMTRIQIDVSVNGLPEGQKLTVDPNHPFYAGLIEQKMAHVIKEDEN